MFLSGKLRENSFLGANNQKELNKEFTENAKGFSILYTTDLKIELKCSHNAY